MMAALSTYYNNWDTLLQTPNFEISSSFLEELTPEELAIVAPHYFPHHFPYSDETFFNLPNNSFLTDFPTNNFLYPEINIPSQLLPFTSFHDQQPFISLNEIFPTEHQDLPCPKRQKFEQEAMHMPCNYFVPNHCFQTEDQFSALLQHEVILPPEHSSATNFVVGSEFEKKGKEERTVSAQSVAARERRRKITEKTQELGKLVPGGPKMNTAEMLHAASKYVKFLQAQVQMLQLINTLEEDDKGAPPSEDQLHTLVVSPYVQEKLYSEERCLVPNEFVTTLTNHGDVRSTPSILKDLNQLIGTEIDKKVKQD